MYRLFLISLAVLLIGCEGIDMNEEIPALESFESAPPQSGEFSFNVSLRTATYFAETQNPEKQLQSIEPLVYSGDTVMYLINYANNEGWMVLSGDKRFEPVLSIHETGNFDNKQTNPGLDLWFGGIAENISYVKKNHLGVVNQEGYNAWAMIDKAANITPEIQEYYDKRYGIIPREHYDIVEENGKTVAKIKAQYAGNYGNGYIYMVKKFVSSTSSPSQITRRVNLVPVKWEQGNPYNTNLPDVLNISNTGWVKPVAGCAAIAIAQTLYSLHFNIGKPNGLYHDISYTGIYYNSNNYSTSIHRDQYNANSSRWNDMPAHWWMPNTSFVADLVSDLCFRLGADFSHNGTGARVNANSFSSWGVTADQAEYNGNTVLSQIGSNRPVLIKAYAGHRKKGIWPFRYDYYYDGHAWVIDGLVERTTTYTTTYRWELATRCPQGDPYYGNYYDPYYPCDPYNTYYNDNPMDPCGRPCDPYVYEGSSYDSYGNKIDWSGNGYPGRTETETHSYSSTNITMNWGWGGSNDGEVAPHATSNSGDGYNYQYQREIIYNFR